MLDTPDADPTWSAGTQAVEADDAGPLDIPIPTAIAIRGSTNARVHPVGVRESDDREPDRGDHETQPDDLAAAQLRRELRHQGCDHDEADGGRQGRQPGLRGG